MQYQAVEIYAAVMQIAEEALFVQKQIIRQTITLKTLTIFFGRFLMYLTSFLLKDGLIHKLMFNQLCLW